MLFKTNLLHNKIFPIKIGKMQICYLKNAYVP